VASWTDNNRNYFIYQHNDNVLNFYTFLSARYEVFRDSWNGIDLEIYYHKPHTYNLDSFMEGMKASLAYYTEAFGPYPYPILRIAEFPRFAYFAQAFPTLIPFSEGVGFIADLKKNTINYPFYITAHEVAHQWWAHQVIGGYVRGTLMLSEAFTEYASLMVVKKRFSDRLYREQLRYTMNQYLMGRSGERKFELPLTQMEMQAYVAYSKGKLVMNATSRLIGEDNLNMALREFLEKYKYAANPYPNTTDFMVILDRFVPDSLKTTIDDMFNKVVLYDHKIIRVNDDLLDCGDFEIVVEFTTEKIYYDDKGVPNRVEYEGWLEIAFLDAGGEIYHIENLRITEKNNTFSMITMQKPAQIVLNPYFITLDITPHNNVHGKGPAGSGSSGGVFISVGVD
jgi:aminopeptidase N